MPNIWFSKEIAKAWGKRKFVNEFKKTYPNVDLAAIFDELVPPDPKAEKPKDVKE